MHAPILPVDLFLRLYKTNATLVRRLEERLHPLDLTLGRLCLLVALRGTEQPMLPSELSDDLAVTRANVSGLLNALERLEMVQRVFDQTDRRRILVHLTEKGRQTLEAAWPIYEEAISSGLGRLTVDEQQTFLQLLKKLESF